MGPQTLLSQVMGLAFGVFNNRNRVEEAKRIQGQQGKAQPLAAALAPAPSQGYPPLGKPVTKAGSALPRRDLF